jgi:hypothetical protein
MRNYIWKTKDGKLINVDDMDVNHLRNSLKMCIRHLETIYAQLNHAQKPKPKVQVNGELASEHADAYEIYKATGHDILSDSGDHCDEWGI